MSQLPKPPPPEKVVPLSTVQKKLRELQDVIDAQSAQIRQLEQPGDSEQAIRFSSRQGINFGFCFGLGISVVILFWFICAGVFSVMLVNKAQQVQREAIDRIEKMNRADDFSP